MLSHETHLSAPSRRPGTPSPPLQLIARVRSYALDERLLAGEDPSGSAVLRTRAAQLTARRSREQLADALRGLLRAAERPRCQRTVSPDPSALLANEHAVRALAERLEQRGPVYAPGVAHIWQLATDSTGPVFRGPAAMLRERLAAAGRELDGAAPVPLLGTPGHLRLSRGQLRRMARRRAWVSGGDVIAGGSFALPDGSWFHGRRDSA